MVCNHFSNFGRGVTQETEIILKLGHWPRSKCRLNAFSMFSSAAILFIGAERF